MMNAINIRSMAIKLCGEDIYDDLQILEDDIKFFTAYMRRNKKSKFSFSIRLSHGMSRRAFDDIWSQYYYSMRDFDVVYFSYIILRKFIFTLESGDPIDTELYSKFIESFEHTYDLKVEDYVADFIGCSQECGSVRDQISKFKERLYAKTNILEFVDVKKSDDGE